MGTALPANHRVTLVDSYAWKILVEDLDSGRYKVTSDGAGNDMDCYNRSAYFKQKKSL